MSDPVYLPQVSVGATSSPRINSGGGFVGRAVADLGEQTNRTATRYLDSELSLMSQSYVSDYYVRASKRLQESKAGYDPSGLGFTDNYMGSFDEDLDNYLKEQNVNPLLIPKIKNSMGGVKRQMNDLAWSYEDSARSEFRKRSVNGALSQISNTALVDPDSYPEQRERVETILGEAQPYLTPEEYTKISEESFKSLDESTLQGLVSKDPIRAKMEIEQGVWDTVDPDVLRKMMAKATNQENVEKIAILSAAAASDPINFARQAGAGSFSDPALEQAWGTIKESEKMEVLTKSISLANMMNNYEDGIRARRDKAIGDRSGDLLREFYSTDDIDRKATLIDQITILGHESGQVINSLRNDLQSDIMGGGRDDPIVYDNILERFVAGDYSIEPMDFIGTGLSRDTAVDLSIKFRTAREGSATEAVNFLKNNVKLQTGWGRLGQAQAEKEEAQLIVEFLDKVTADRTKDPMDIARAMVEEYDEQKSVENARSGLERGVIDSLKGLDVARRSRSPSGGPPNEDIPRLPDGTIDTNELINRMNYYMMEGIIDREEFVNGPARAIRELHDFNKRMRENGG